MPHNAEKSAAQVRERLAGLGLPAVTLERIGAFLMVWGMFETALEPATWALRDESVRGRKPSTDGPPASDWIGTLAKGNAKFPTDANDVVKAGAQAAADLMEYRHTLIHGAMIPFPDGPVMIRNPGWHGEKRKRPARDAHISARLLDLATDTAWSLCRLAWAVEKCCGDLDTSIVVQLRPEIVRAVSVAHELRHLTAMMNSEKY